MKLMLTFDAQLLPLIRVILRTVFSFTRLNRNSTPFAHWDRFVGKTEKFLELINYFTAEPLSICVFTQNWCSNGKTGKTIPPMFAYFAKTMDLDPRACQCFWFLVASVKKKTKYLQNDQKRPITWTISETIQFTWNLFGCISCKQGKTGGVTAHWRKWITIKTNE